jgi:asparagine synthase (glutamine-hydrolysing)
VQLRLISDVPLGAFLSGGIDSSAVVAMMSKHHSAVKTLSIGFGGQIGAYDDERKYARLISRRYETDHREYEIHANECNSALIEKIIQAFDEPFADHGAIPMYFVCKMARENMTVALSGLGGDELFAGYRRQYGFYLGELYNAAPALLRERLLPWMVEKIPESKGGANTVNLIKRFVRGGKLTAEKRYLTYVDLLSGHSQAELFTDSAWMKSRDQHYQEEFYSFFRSDNAADSMNKVYYTDIKTYLPDDILALTDRISMMHSLEVRVPFLDHKLVEFCATIPPRLKMKHFRQKYLLKKAVSNLLPKEVLTHRKQGFVAPMNIWLNHQLKEYVHAVLLEQKSDFFNREAVAGVLKQHYNGEQLNTSLIWSLLVFTLWHKNARGVRVQ